MSDNNQEQQPVHEGTDDGARQAENSPSEAETLESDLKEIQQERDALFEQMARVQADFRNAQKRLESDKVQAIQFANAKLVQALIPVIDSLERALEVDPAKADAPSLIRGMQVVYDQLMHVLQQQHVQIIAPKPGDAFDPNLHHAVMQQPPSHEASKGPGDQAEGEPKGPTVTQLFQKGYVIHGRTLRAAQVAVAKGE